MSPPLNEAAQKLVPTTNVSEMNADIDDVLNELPELTPVLTNTKLAGAPIATHVDPVVEEESCSNLVAQDLDTDRALRPTTGNSSEKIAATQTAGDVLSLDKIKIKMKNAKASLRKFADSISQPSADLNGPARSYKRLFRSTPSSGPDSLDLQEGTGKYEDQPEQQPGSKGTPTTNCSKDFSSSLARLLGLFVRN